MVIHPEIIVTPDCPTIKFRQPKENVDLDIQISKILNVQGWSCGTYFNVQFISHDKTKLMASARYVVTEELEFLHVNESNPMQTMTKAVTTRKAKQIGDWFYPNPLEVEESVQIEPPVGPATVNWNPGKKMHQVIIDGGVIFESKNKQEAVGVANAGNN